MVYIYTFRVRVQYTHTPVEFLADAGAPLALHSPRMISFDFHHSTSTATTITTIIIIIINFDGSGCINEALCGDQSLRVCANSFARKSSSSSRALGSKRIRDRTIRRVSATQVYGVLYDRALWMSEAGHGVESLGRAPDVYVCYLVHIVKWIFSTSVFCERGICLAEQLVLKCG